MDWISVEERLPKDEQEVQIAHIHTEKYVFSNLRWFRKYSETNRFEISSPTHWRTVPEKKD